MDEPSHTKRETLKRGDIFKAIFSLGVKLAGLYFLCIGLKGMEAPAFMDLTTIRCDNLSDVISALIPVVFNCLVAWWLFGCRFLSCRAYPGIAINRGRATPTAETPTLSVKPSQAASVGDVEALENKLSALVRKPNSNSPA